VIVDGSREKDEGQQVNGKVRKARVKGENSNIHLRIKLSGNFAGERV